MTVYMLSNSLSFPSPEDADQEGLLAIGGDLSPERLVLAYSMGIFPWFSEEDPILWWSPDPRMVIRPEDFEPSRSLRKAYKRGEYRLSMDEDYEAVVRACARVPRRGQDRTWITQEMQNAYIALHRTGVGHSVECWSGDDLVGGLYGLSLGDCFFGESMFSKRSNTSKLAFWALTHHCREVGIRLVDCQLHNEHLESLGAYIVSRSEYLQQLYGLVSADTRKGSWTEAFCESTQDL